jgi:hypothetical protein
MNSISKIRGLRPRQVKFRSLAEVLQDAEVLCSSSQIIRLGNWTVGQALDHLAKAIHSSLVESRAILPLRFRLLAKIGKPFFLRWGLPAGVQIEAHSEIAAREFLPRPKVSADEGLNELRRVIGLTANLEMNARHNLFGRMTTRQWMMLHCRHAELHLRLFIPQETRDIEASVSSFGVKS